MNELRGRACTLGRRQMYSDILFNGSRRFAVPVSHPETGRLASVAPVFYLEDLKEVSEQTQDAVKYVCSHKVIGRVRIKRTLNDHVWADRSTYLKAVVEPLEDGDDDEAGTRRRACVQCIFHFLTTRHRIARTPPPGRLLNRHRFSLKASSHHRVSSLVSNRVYYNTTARVYDSVSAGLLSWAK